MGMTKNFAVYFPNTELITDILADTWDIDNDGYLTFYDKGNGISSSKKMAIAVFSMSNILGFKEVIEDGQTSN